MAIEATEMETDLEIALAFTRAFKAHRDDHVAIREAMCLKEQYPAICAEILDGDLIAGRQKLHPGVAFALEYYREIYGDPPRLKAQSGYAFSETLLRKACRSSSEGDRSMADGLIDFWNRESTLSRYDALLGDDLRAALDEKSENLMHGAIRVACVSIDYDKLTRLGIPGLADEIRNAREGADVDGGDVQIYDGMLLALEALVDVCRHYEREARSKAEATSEEKRAGELLTMAETLARIAVEKPTTLREAMQLFWLYNLVAGTQNYGRMDIYLGDFYARDLDNGELTEDEAQALINSLWRIIADRRYEGHTAAQSNNRIIIGGMGRRNEANADRFALAAMEATRQLKVMEPQLSLRFYKGQNPALMKKALDVIGEEALYPMLYNDDVNVPGVQKAFGVPLEDAQEYLPGGCGEYALAHLSITSPNCALNLLKVLELVLHNGCDALTGERIGLETGLPNEFDTFDKIVDAYRRQLERCLSVLARRHAVEYEAERQSSPFLFMTMLMDDGIERGKGLMDGGARYLGACLECFGLTNASDSLTAIRELVYEKEMFTLDQLVAMLDADFEGFERERHVLLNAPKYGNDLEAADRTLVELSRMINTTAMAQAEPAGLAHCLTCNLNPGGYEYGLKCVASADGRHCGDPFAIGNAPTAGRDRNGITALFNSLAKPEPTHAGYVQNMKFSKAMFSPEHRGRLDALMDTYFANGGTQAMITVISRDELEQAMKEPEKYAHVLVRVGGFSARFVELGRDMQLEIIQRTLY